MIELLRCQVTLALYTVSQCPLLSTATSFHWSIDLAIYIRFAFGGYVIAVANAVIVECLVSPVS